MKANMVIEILFNF